jgi:hypothetical protein
LVTELMAVVLDTLRDIAPRRTSRCCSRTRTCGKNSTSPPWILNFVIASHEKLGVDIPEPDYPQLTALHGAVA